jgi:hypothetical protein
MGIFQRIVETAGELISYSQGYDAGEEWKENGGGPVDSTMLHRIHVSRGIETSDWRAYNEGFTDAAGSRDDEEEEPDSDDQAEEKVSDEGESSGRFLWGLLG